MRFFRFIFVGWWGAITGAVVLPGIVQAEATLVQPIGYGATLVQPVGYDAREVA